VRPEGLGQLKKSSSSGTRTGDLPVCSIVPPYCICVHGMFILSTYLTQHNAPVQHSTYH
jgi:hypothetical protein